MFSDSFKSSPAFFPSFHFTKYNKLFKNNHHNIASLLCINHVHVFCFLHFIFRVIYLNNMSLIFLMFICSFFNHSSEVMMIMSEISWTIPEQPDVGVWPKQGRSRWWIKSKAHFHKNIPNNENLKKPNVGMLKLNTSSKHFS